MAMNLANKPLGKRFQPWVTRALPGILRSGGRRHAVAHFRAKDVVKLLADESAALSGVALKKTIAVYAKLQTGRPILA